MAHSPSPLQMPAKENPLQSQACPNAQVTPAAVSLENMFFSQGKELILDDVTLAIHQGDFMALIGPNGGGKTTLLKLMLGLLTPQSGSVSIFGSSPEDMSANMGYVPQFSSIRTECPVSILDIVLMGAATRSLSGGKWAQDTRSKERAMAYLDTLGVADIAGASPGKVSGGQLQRALVARALMGKPESNNAPFLLLLDEPTASIDPQGKFCFYEFLGSLRGEATIVVVSHDLYVASPFFSHAAFVNRQVTLLPDNSPLTPETLIKLFGIHEHECPMADLQQGRGTTASTSFV